ncbi:uncharacterized protein LOC127084545 isoform X1 [Lathyrus oleraceus]|uniref:uncharacterized protein LOC127084545 isoform X1 n=1 Tax=Pisum sativum TaxID=3888 RepID=UPI0021CE9F39|nr:uncharacterized protein LOC127084545 isoform X1 [Pisum sativum]
MASFLTDLAKPYVEKLINGVIAESSYICCFMCIAKDFEEEKARLEVERTTFKQRIEVATRRGEDVQANALSWVEEADKLIQEDTKTKQKCFFEFCPHCIWRYRRGKVLANRKDHIKELMEVGKELTIGLPARLPDVERYSSQHYMHFKSRESKYIELLDELKDDNNYMIGLQGMGGTGKTTLIKEVGKTLKQSKQFTQIIDTAVSFSPNIKKIQDDIAGPLGLKFDDCNESDRPKKLWSRLTNGEKILLILDDVWGDIDFNEIGIPYSDNHKGCRIVVTTRSLLVCKKLGCNKTIQLDLLSEEDAWILFKRHASLSETSTEFFLDKGRKIANECKRLPIAIVVIASSLKGEQHRNEWDVALKSFQKPMSIHGVDDELVKIYNCLKFSYDNMRNEKAKSLFLLCSVFREDEEVLTERLARLAIGGGLFGEDYGSYQDARSQVVISKNKLLDSCLLLEADQGIVKMHDLVRDAAQWIANKEIQTVQVYDKNQKAMVEREKNIKYLLCEGKPKDVFSCKLDGSKLEILIVILCREEGDKLSNIKVPDSFFENNTGLRVFVCDFFFLNLSLPQSIQSLQNIRSLIFRSGMLGDISILGNLPSLETLDLSGCRINELPSGITKLDKFRLLKLEHCSISWNNPFEVIERCSLLQELYFVGSFNHCCREITLPTLQMFCVADGSGIDYSSSSKCVSIDYENEFFLSETTLKYCMQEAEVLKLGRIEGVWRNIIPEIVPLDHGMNDLVVLGLSCISQLQCLIETKHTSSQVSHVFSKLVKLHLEKMENLEELCIGPLSFDTFKSLEDLSIGNCKHLRSLFKCNLSLRNLKKVSLNSCPMLISLFELSTARSLVLLEILEIIDCEGLEYIILDERKGEGSRREIIDDDSKSLDPMFLKLKALEIRKCPNFKVILPFVSAHDLPALESITMRSCDKLKYIFGQDVKLGSLKYINLDDVPNLIDIFPESNHTTSLSNKKSSSISRSASKPATQSDYIKCNIFSWIDMYYCGNKLRSTKSTKIPLVHVNQPQNNLMESNSYCLSINIWERAQCISRQSKILCNVKEIQLTELRKIKSIFVLSIAPRMLLETLIIKGCDELKHIIIDTEDHDNADDNNLDNVFPKLKVLSIIDCIRLEYIFGHYNDDHQNDIEVHLHLPALECLYLSNLQNLAAMCPKQYHTTFPPLKDLVLDKCLQVADMKPIGDFISHHLVSRSVDGTITKKLSGNMEYLLALERLGLCMSKVESIFCVNEVNEQQINLVLRKIMLDELYVVTCLFVGPKDSFVLQNLITIQIMRCEKLQVIFSDSILRCLPQLHDIMIIECDELKHIIEDDLENKKMSNSSSSRTCFPKLNVLVVIKCNKLKCVFSTSVSNELPELKCLIIREADELEEIFKTEGEENQKAKILNLKFVAFVNLPSLFQTQGIQFQTVESRFVMDCQKLSLTSTSRLAYFWEIIGSDSLMDMDEGALRNLLIIIQNIQEESRGHNTKDFIAGIEVEAASRHELTSSEENEYSTSPLGEPDATAKPSQENNLESSMSGKDVATTFPTISENKNEPTVHSDAPKQKQGAEISVEEGITSNNAKTITSSTHLELEHGDNQIAAASFSIGNKETNDQVSRIDDALKNVSSNIEEQLSKEDDIIVSKSKPSSIAYQFPSIPSKGNSSKNVENLSSSMLVTKELEQLVSEKHLASENLSLLTDFFVLHPTLHLKDISLSNRYKGYAYDCLAELLKFLKTHSVLDVLGSSRSEFIELLQDARRFPFDKEWLDVVEKRVMFPGLQVSQAALQKLLDSKLILTEHVKDLKHQLTSSEAVLENITQQEAQVLETRATLSDPIGY